MVCHGYWHGTIYDASAFPKEDVTTGYQNFEIIMYVCMMRSKQVTLKIKYYGGRKKINLVTKPTVREKNTIQRILSRMWYDEYGMLAWRWLAG